MTDGQVTLDWLPGDNSQPAAGVHESSLRSGGLEAMEGEPKAWSCLEISYLISFSFPPEVGPTA